MRPTANDLWQVLVNSNRQIANVVNQLAEERQTTRNTSRDLTVGQQRNLLSGAPALLRHLREEKTEIRVLSKWAEAAVTKETHKMRKAFLEKLEEFWETNTITPSMVIAYIEHRHEHPLKRLKGNRQETTWATTRRLMATAIKACELTELYVPSIPAFRVLNDVDFRMSLSYVDKQLKQETPDFPKPAIFEKILEAVATGCATQQEAAATMLAMDWINAGRLPDTKRLRVRSILLCPTNPTMAMAIQWTECKVVELGGNPYTTHPATGVFHEVIARYLKERVRAPKDEFLFPERDKVFQQAVQLMKRVDPQLTDRSIRRGALQAMADNGVPDNILLQFSQHTSLKMLHRYLAWGFHGLLRATAEAEASMGIAGGNDLPKWQEKLRSLMKR